jgi:DNA-binding NarL/FixJ family response regulator
MFVRATWRPPEHSRVVRFDVRTDVAFGQWPVNALDMTSTEAGMAPGTAPARVWVDDRHPIFRRGLASLLAADGFTVAGESAALDPAPDPAAIDVLVFEATPSSFTRAVASRRHTGVRFVAVLPVLREQLMYEALDSGVAAVLLREEIQPRTLLATVRAVTAGNTTLPSDLVPRLLARAAHEASAGSRGLSDRELAVLRLLSEGNDTIQIGDSLGYSERTVKNIVHDLLMKMNCRNRVHAVALATREGLI